MRFLPLIFLIAMLQSCGQSGVYSIGLITSLSGIHADQGQQVRNGTRLAVEEINSRGGIRGRKINLVITDDESSPSVALKRAMELKDAGIRIILGPYTSGNALAVIPFINSNRLLCFGSTVSAEEVMRRDDHFITLIPSSRVFALELSSYALKQGYKRFSCIYDSVNKGFVETWYTNFRDNLVSNGGSMALSIQYSSLEKPSLKGLAFKAVQSGAQAILIVSSGLNLGLLCQYIRQAAPGIPIFTTPWGITAEFLQNAGAASENVFFCLPFDENSTNTAYLAFAGNYQKRFSINPTLTGAFFYEAVTVLSEALKKAGSDDPDLVKEAVISTGTYSGLQSLVSISREGDCSRPILVQKISNGHVISAR